MMPVAGTVLLLLAQMQPLIIPGERLTYDVSSSRFGDMGQAVFSVTELDNGNVQLSFEFDARVLLFRASDRTTSELDYANLRTVRYRKRERSPLGGRDEQVVIDRVARTWTEDGRVHPLASADPLDELSMIYLIRGLDLGNAEHRIVMRHFDEARNPIHLRATAAEHADIIEMRVPDPRQDHGESVLRFHISRDPARVPLRIESTMPVAGRVTMTLVNRN